MLVWTGMDRNVRRQTVRIGFTLLLILPNVIATAGTLREEAINYRVQGYEAQRRGDSANALPLYQKAAALDPTYATPQNDIGVLLEEQGRLEEAERAYQQGLQLNPNYLEAHGNLAMLYERMGQKEKAIYHWMKRYQLGDPYDPWTARAEERLVALGALKTYPGLKGRIYTRRRVIDQEFNAHAQSKEEFNAIASQHGDWP